VIDFLISLLAWIKYIAQVVQWLLTVLPGLGLDVATFPAREFLYYTVVSPLYSLFMASRKLLVLEGFLVPKPEEIEAGLITLGVQTGHQRQTLTADLNDPSGFAPTTITFDEPSGKAKPTDEWESDRAFPRQSMRDPVQQINQALAPFGLSLLPTTGDEPYSHWVIPWKYPETDLAGDRIGWEPHLAHVGPWNQGAVATDMFDRADTNLNAAARFEQAKTPEETSTACHDLFPNDAHLGHPVDYSLYLVQRLGARVAVPNFNLDSDRGYGFRCWDYDRHDRRQVPPLSVEDFRCPEPFAVKRFAMQQPCTVPEQFNPAWSANDPASAQDPRHIVNRYRPSVGLQIHYLDPGLRQPICTDLTSTIGIAEVGPEERNQAGRNPDGSEV
jgi:hypothetical protein